jgi:membrane protease YdiL (CAAX protease family)
MPPVGTMVASRNFAIFVKIPAGKAGMVDDQGFGPEPTPDRAPSDVRPWAAGAGSANHFAEPLFSPFWRALLYVVVCVVVYVGGSFVASILAAIVIFAKYGNVTPELMLSEPGILTATTLLVCNPLLIATTIGYVWLIDRGSLARIGLRGPRIARDLLQGAALGVGFVLLLMALYAVLGWQHYTAIPIDVAMWIGTILVLYPLIGLTEEVVFRGYLLQTLDEWQGRWVAIVVTCVLFWLPHLPQGNVGTPLGAAAILSIGLTFALCRYGTGTLWLPIALHAAYDGALMSLMETKEMGFPAFFRVTVTAPPWLVGPPGHVGIADLGLHLLFLWFVYQWIYRPSLRRANVNEDGDAADALSAS